MYDELMSRLKNLSCIEIKNGEDVTPISAEAVKCIREIANEAADAIEELFGKVEQLPRWIPVTERLPDYNGFVLVYAVGGAFVQISCMDIVVCGGGNFFGESIEDMKVTHWMPLPEPPKER